MKCIWYDCWLLLSQYIQFEWRRATQLNNSIEILERIGGSKHSLIVCIWVRYAELIVGNVYSYSIMFNSLFKFCNIKTQKPIFPPRLRQFLITSAITFSTLQSRGIFGFLAQEECKAYGRARHRRQIPYLSLVCQHSVWKVIIPAKYFSIHRFWWGCWVQ